MNKKFYGFTLSEVLITLGIIGIVSAITMPTLTKRYQEFVLKKQFAKFYSTISQAFSRGYYDNGMSWNCYYALNNNGSIAGWNGSWDNCSTDGREVFKYLKIIKKCTYSSGDNNCIGIKTYPKLSGSNYSTDNIYFLNDGTIVATPAATSLLSFAVDLNGTKGPNKKGYDIFYFITARDGFVKNKFYIAPYPNHAIDEGGKTTQEMFESYNH